MSDTTGPANSKDSLDPEVPMQTRVVLTGLMEQIVSDSNRRDERYDRIHRRFHWGLVIVGLVALVVGAQMFTLIEKMDDDMDAMSVRMAEMSMYMKDMHVRMASMSTSMESMEGAILPMSNYMGGMRDDVGQMTRAMDRMQIDTGYMRHGVGAMAHDTAAMGQPFRVMDRFLPW